MDLSIKVRWFWPVIAYASAVAIFALPMRGQAGPSTVPTGTSVSAPAPDGQQAAPSQGAASQVATIHAYSNLVVIDVVVSDSKKAPVHGLKASDFTLLENGKPQTIRHFEEHNASTATRLVAVPQLPAGLFTNQSPAPANGPVNVLLLDYLNTPLTSQAIALQQLRDYLNKAPAGTRIAIFGLTYKLVLLQGFTSDISVLKAALNSTVGRPQFSDLLPNPVNGGSVSDSTFTGSVGGVGASFAAALGTSGSSEVGLVINQFLNESDAQITSEIENDRAVYTLNAFDDLARYLVGIPGRKNVVWFSGSFPLDVEPNGDEGGGNGIGNPNDSVIRNDMEVRKTDNLLTRAQVAVYPVDVRGLQADPSLSAANSTISASYNPTAPTGYLTQLAQEQETMYEMADDTGGEAFVNTNGLTQAMTKAIEHGSNYYTLTYVPANTQWDERFRSIKVKVDDPDAKQLNYRNGYYAFDPNDRNKLNAQGAATALSTPSSMTTAMMHGGPDPAEILFKVRIRPAGTPPQATVGKSNRTNPDPKVKVEGPYKAYGVDMVPDAHAVTCSEDANGDRHCALEIWTYVYNSDGQLLVTTGNRLHTLLTPADYTKMLAGGLAFHQQISVPVKGLHFLRTGIHDMVSDRVGAVEIPVAQVARLDPLQPLPQMPAPNPSGFGPAGSAATPAAAASSGAAVPSADAAQETTPADTTVDTIASPVERPAPAPPPPAPSLQRRTTPPDAPATP